MDKDSRISKKGRAVGLSVFKNCDRNTLKTFKTTGGIQRHPGFGR